MVTHIRNRQNGRAPVSVAAFLFRMSPTRETRAECRTLVEKYKAVAANYVDNSILLEKAIAITPPPRYETLAGHPLLPPGIPADFPYGQMGTGFRLYRDLIEEPDAAEHAVIITSVKGIDNPGDLVVESETSLLLVSNVVGNVLMCVVLRAKTPDNVRRLWPNMIQDAPEDISMNREDCIGFLARLIGYNKYVVGWKVEADLTALGIAIPAIQVIDLAHEPVVMDTLLLREDLAAPLDITHLALPRAVWDASQNHINIRFFGGKDIRDPFFDNRCVLTFWRKFGNRIIQNRVTRYRADLLAWAQTYVGSGRALEAVALIRDVPFAPLLPREDELQLPCGINPVKDVGNVLYSHGYRNEHEFYDRMMERTSNADGSPLFNLENLQLIIDSCNIIELEIGNKPIVDNREFAPVLANLQEGTYDWSIMLAENEKTPLKNGIAFAEDLPGMLSEYEEGPIKIYQKFSVTDDPEHQMSSEVEAVSDIAQVCAKSREQCHRLFLKDFTGHYKGPPSSTAVLAPPIFKTPTAAVPPSSSATRMPPGQPRMPRQPSGLPPQSGFQFSRARIPIPPFTRLPSPFIPLSPRVPASSGIPLSEQWQAHEQSRSFLELERTPEGMAPVLRNVVTRTIVQTVRVRSRSEERRSYVSRTDPIFPVPPARTPLPSPTLAITHESRTTFIEPSRSVPTQPGAQISRGSSSSTTSENRSSSPYQSPRTTSKTGELKPKTSKKLSVQEYQHKRAVSKPSIEEQESQLRDTCPLLPPLPLTPIPKILDISATPEPLIPSIPVSISPSISMVPDTSSVPPTDASLNPSSIFDLKPGEPPVSTGSPRNRGERIFPSIKELYHLFPSFAATGVLPTPAEVAAYVDNRYPKLTVRALQEEKQKQENVLKLQQLETMKILEEQRIKSIIANAPSAEQLEAARVREMKAEQRRAASYEQNLADKLEYDKRMAQEQKRLEILLAEESVEKLNDKNVKQWPTCELLELI